MKISLHLTSLVTSREQTATPEQESGVNKPVVPTDLTLLHLDTHTFYTLGPICTTTRLHVLSPSPDHLIASIQPLLETAQAFSKAQQTAKYLLVAARQKKKIFYMGSGVCPQTLNSGLQASSHRNFKLLLGDRGWREFRTFSTSFRGCRRKKSPASVQHRKATNIPKASGRFLSKPRRKTCWQKHPAPPRHFPSSLLGRFKDTVLSALATRKYFLMVTVRPTSS